MASQGKGAKVSGSNYLLTRENESFIISGKVMVAKPLSEIKNHFGYIYITKDTVNSKYYLGLRFKKRSTLSYLGSGKYLKSAIHKYGKFNFYKIVIDFAENQEDLEKLEQFYIQKYFGYDIAKSTLWYNIYDGKQRGGDSWAGYTLADRLRRSKLLSSHQKGRIVSKSAREFSSKFMHNYFKNPANRKKTSLATRKKMNTQEIADKTNNYIKYPININGKDYYSAAQIGRAFNLQARYVYDRLRKGMEIKDVIKQPTDNKDWSRWGHLEDYNNRVKGYKTYARLYKVQTVDGQYLLLSSSYSKLARLITKITGHSIGKHYTGDLIKKRKSEYNGIIAIDQIDKDKVPDKYKTLYACCTINYQMQDKEWDGVQL